MEPDISLLGSRRFRVLPVLVILAICAFGVWLLTLSPKPRPRKPPVQTAPAQAAPVKAAPSPLFVILVPPRGWCCAGRTKLSEASRTACETARGVFFETEERARVVCGPGKPSTAPSGSPRGRGKGA